MASQNPSTAYTAAPEKKSGSWFPSFSLPKLPDFFGTGASSAAPAPAPSAPATAIAEQSSVQPGGRRRRGRKTSKKAGRRRTRRGGLTPAEGIKWKDSDVRYMTQGTKYDFPPTQVRKPTGKGRRTHRVKKHSRR